MNRHMTTAHSNKTDFQILIDQDPGSGFEIWIRFFERSETDRIRNID